MYKIKPLTNIDWEKLPYFLNEQQTSQVTGVSLSYLQKARMGSVDGQTEGPPVTYFGRTVRYGKEGLSAWAKKVEGYKLKSQGGENDERV